jgi:hypothetical protein
MKMEFIETGVSSVRINKFSNDKLSVQSHILLLRKLRHKRKVPCSVAGEQSTYLLFAAEKTITRKDDRK